jgi:hypothetical protein
LSLIDDEARRVADQQVAELPLEASQLARSISAGSAMIVYEPSR